MTLGGEAAHRLDACPLCRSILPAGDPPATRCPECSADLAPYLELASRATQYARLARELLTQGQVAEASAVIDGLTRIAELDPVVQAELSACLALAERRFAEALELAREVPPPAGELIAREAREGLARQRTAEELYNSALAAARNGEYYAAAQRLVHAVEYAPANPALWQLKLKVDLKCHHLSRCYRDLAVLDQLGARQPYFTGLEQLLPAVNPAEG